MLPNQRGNRRCDKAVQNGIDRAKHRPTQQDDHKVYRTGHNINRQMRAQHFDRHRQEIGVAAGRTPHIQKRQCAAPCDAREQCRQQRIAAVAGLVCKDNILKKGTPQHTDDRFPQEGASHKAETKQNQRLIQHQRCDADGDPPQIVAQQGKTRQPAGCKVGTLGKISDAQGV